MFYVGFGLDSERGLKTPGTVQTWVWVLSSSPTSAMMSVEDHCAREHTCVVFV